MVGINKNTPIRWKLNSTQNLAVIGKFVADSKDMEYL